MDYSRRCWIDHSCHGWIASEIVNEYSCLLRQSEIILLSYGLFVRIRLTLVVVAIRDHPPLRPWVETPACDAALNGHAVSVQFGPNSQLANGRIDAEDSHETYRKSDGTNYNEKVNSWQLTCCSRHGLEETDGTSTIDQVAHGLHLLASIISPPGDYPEVHERSFPFVPQGFGSRAQDDTTSLLPSYSWREILNAAKDDTTSLLPSYSWREILNAAKDDKFATTLCPLKRRE